MPHARRVEHALEGDPPRALVDVARDHPRRTLVHRRPVLPARSVDLLLVEVALVEGVPAAVAQAVWALAYMGEEIEPAARRKQLAAPKAVDEREDASRVGLVPQLVVRRLDRPHTADVIRDEREIRLPARDRPRHEKSVSSAEPNERAPSSATLASHERPS